jgi:hypothetical protein
VVFRLRNRGDRTLYLRQGCVGIAFDVSSCGSRYTDGVGPRYACGCLCGDASCTGTVACGPCPPDAGLAVAPGEAKDVPWSAILTTLQDRPGYSCVERTPLPAARYAVSFPLFDTDSAAAGHELPVRFAAGTFELPAPGDLVELSLGAPPPDGGAPACVMASAQPPPVCASPWDPSAPCSLDASYTFGWDGGFVAAREESLLTPPSTYTFTRTTFSTPASVVSCTNQLPRCGAASDLYTTADVLQALAAPDVAAALAQPAPLVYGRDDRPVDGAVLAVRRADGRGLILGDPCGTGPCDRPLTEGMIRLAAILHKIEAQQRALPGCEALRQP